MSKERFEEVVNILSMEHNHVEAGKMMSAPGVRYKQKVFSFYYNDKMIFKLGKDYDLNKHGIETYTYLNPFKNKGPMTAWYEIDETYEDKWFDLASVALEKMIEQVEA